MVQAVIPNHGKKITKTALVERGQVEHSGVPGTSDQNPTSNRERLHSNSTSGMEEVLRSKILR